MPAPEAAWYVETIRRRRPASLCSGQVGGNEADDGCAIGVRDDVARVVGDVCRVDLGDDQGHVGLEAEGMGVVHAHGAALGGFGEKGLRGRVTGRTKNNVRPLEGIGRGLDHGHGLAVEGDGLANRARARKGHELSNGEVPLLEALDHLRANDARGAENGDGLVCHVAIPLSAYARGGSLF